MEFRSYQEEVTHYYDIRPDARGNCDSNAGCGAPFFTDTNQGWAIANQIKLQRLPAFLRHRELSTF